MCTSHEDVKGNAKYKNYCFKPFFGGVKVNAQSLPMLDGKHIVHFLLVIIELFRRLSRLLVSVVVPEKLPGQKRCDEEEAEEEEHEFLGVFDVLLK